MKSKAQNGSKRSVPFIVTVALEAEIPIAWLKEKEVFVCNIRRLKAEGPQIIGSSTAIIVTGVGPKASQSSALWIRDHLAPLFVVNIGTAASLSSRDNLGDWVMPNQAKSETQDAIPLDTRMPFPVPHSFQIKKGGTILSAPKPQLSRDSGTLDDVQYIDMECFAQATVFKDSGISFHVIKGISDFSSNSTNQQFSETLGMLRDSLCHVLEFLEPSKEPGISVVIPVYNREQAIRNCLDSVLAQTYSPKDIIVVDDGSTDHTSDSLKQYEDQITIFSLKENIGVSGARNRGIQRARGPWISFLDSDDIWEKDMLLSQARFIEKHPYYEIMQTEEIWIRNGVRVNRCKHHEKPEGWIWSRSLERCLVSPSAVTIKKDLLSRHDNFDETLPVCEDYDLWIRIARHHPVGLISTPCLVKKGGHDDQLSTQYPAMDQYRVKALLKALDQETDAGYRSQIKDVLTRKLHILANGCRKRNNLEQAQYYESILASAAK